MVHGLFGAVKDVGTFVVRASLLVLLLLVISRLPFFRQLFYRRDTDERTQALFSVFWMVPALVAPWLTLTSAFVPFFAGRFGGLGPGYAVGAVAGACLAFRGASIPVVLLHVAAGILGGLLARRLGPGRTSPIWLAPAAAAISLVAMDVPGHPGRWLTPRLLHSLPGDLLRMGITVVAFSLVCFAMLRSMDWLMTEGERERAQAADRVLSLAGEAAGLLGDGLDTASAEKLTALIQRTLQLPAAFLLMGGQPVAFEGPCPHHLVGQLVDGEADHRKLFTDCPRECSYSRVLLAPLQVGGRTVAHLGVMGTHEQALAPSVEGALRGLAMVLSGLLSQVRVSEQRRHLERARFRFLQAQIRPHFLFNTLNTIAALASAEPRVRTLVGNLARFLRESFRQDRPLVPLEHELEVVRAYLAIEKERFGPRLQIEEDLPDPLPAAMLPPFTIQPLVENAVIHGLGQKASGGRLVLRVSADTGGVTVRVEDDGPGVAVVSHSDQGGIGLSNVDQRLQTAFGAQAGLVLENRPEGGARARFWLPLRAQEVEDTDASLVSADRG